MVKVMIGEKLMLLQQIRLLALHGVCSTWSDRSIIAIKEIFILNQKQFKDRLSAVFFLVQKLFFSQKKGLSKTKKNLDEKNL